MKEVIEVAKAHTIDAADPQLLDALNRERGEQLAPKNQLTVQEIKAGIRRGNVISADDYQIADIRVHRDLAEFQYDIRGPAVFFRPLDGWWPESLRKVLPNSSSSAKRWQTAASFVGERFAVAASLACLGCYEPHAKSKKQKKCRFYAMLG